MELSEEDAAAIVEHVLDALRACNASDLVIGIEESQQLGIEETVGQIEFDPDILSKADVRDVGTTRRRPRTAQEMLRLVFERLHQRLIVLPEIALAIKQRVAEQVVWRVDTDFVSDDRIHLLEMEGDDLLPSELLGVDNQYDALLSLIPEFVPKRRRDG